MPTVSLKGAKPTASQLPIINSSSRHHERLHRSLLTLQAMARKTDRKFSTFVESESLEALWTHLEEVSNRLKLYLVEEEENIDGTGAAGGGDGDGTSGGIVISTKSNAQASLTSVLVRLLPLYESFLLATTCDLQIPTVSPVEETPQQSTDTGANAAASTGEPVLPGARFRNSRAYEGMNVSLITTDDHATATVGSPNSTSSSHRGKGDDKTDDADSDSALGLGPPPTLTKVSSLTRTGSIRRQGSALLYLGPGVALTPPLARAQRLLTFVQSHSGVLNLIIAARPSLLHESLAFLIRIPQLRAHLNFENKRKYFLRMLSLRGGPDAHRYRRRIGPHLQLRRDNVFEDSFHQLRQRSTEEMRGKLQVNFHGEEGVDAGGLTREWFLVLSREIFNPNYALFTADASGTTFQPNSHSMININHLDYFTFVGRVIGKAICDQHLMDAHFTRSFYKHILGQSVDYADIEAIEPDYYKSLKQILDYSLEDLGIDLDFSAETITFGKHEVVDLIPNGRNIEVTDDNKEDYIRLVAHHRMTTSIKAQLDAFLVGFYDMVPPALITIFSPSELELLICGLPEVDLDDLYQNTDYHSYHAAEPVIQWFWEALRSFSTELKNKFLAFVTGSSKVPLDGFKNLQGMRGTQKFNIHKVFGPTAHEMLPSAHTCFNQLDLPAYRSAEELKSKLLLAVNEANEGFGFA